MLCRVCCAPQVVAVDADVSAALRRGLKAVPLPMPLASADSLLAALVPGGSRGFDALVVFGAPNEGQLEAGGMGPQWQQPEVLAVLTGLVKGTGRWARGGRGGS
jgi:hypothetical protein